MIEPTELFHPDTARSRPDLHAVRLLELVADFARSAVIAAQPELRDEPTDDDQPPDFSKRIALNILDVFELLTDAANLYIEHESRERLRRSLDLPF